MTFLNSIGLAVGSFQERTMFVFVLLTHDVKSTETATRMTEPSVLLQSMGILPFIKNFGRLLKNAHLRRYPYSSSLRRTSMYASILGISDASHLDLFDQPA